MLRNEVILKRIKLWQEEPIFHQLTCGNNSKHSILKGEERDDKIVLFCEDCDYIQDYIPDIFYKDNFEELYKKYSKLLNLF